MDHRANLYVVILTINCGIYALYVVIFFGWLHVAQIVLHLPSRIPGETAMTMHNPFFDTDQMSLAELRERIAADHELSVYKRRDIASACRSLADWFHLPETSIPASAPYIREKLERVHPTLINVTRRRVQNVRSLILGAMRHLTINTKLAPASAKLSPEWQALYDLLSGDIYRKSELSRFMRYCSKQSVLPADISDAVSDRYLVALEAESLIKHPRVRHQSTCRVWNQMVEKHRCAGWPLVTLTVPRYEDRLYAINWSLISDEVKADIDAYLDHLSSKDLFSKGLKKPFAPVSINTVRGQLHRYISALHYEAVDIHRAKSLKELVTPPMFELGISWLLKRNKGETSRHIGEIAWSVRCYAVKYCDPSEEDVAFFAEHMPKLRLSHDGLSEKNMACMHQFDDPKTVLRFLTLPQVLWDRARSMSKTVEQGTARKDAHLLVQSAVAIEILQFAPMRIRNLNMLRLDQHLIWHGKCLRIFVPMEEVKNKVALDYLLPEATTERVKRYVDDWRMMFTPGASSYLFPGRKAGAKDCSALRKQISRALWDHAAISLTPHQFRHAAAKLLLDRLPGHYAVVRKLLGHKALKTTFSHYSGAETQKAIELYGEVITKTRRDGVAQAFREQKQNPRRHEDLFVDPLTLMGKPRGVRNEQD